MCVHLVNFKLSALHAVLCCFIQLALHDILFYFLAEASTVTTFAAAPEVPLFNAPEEPFAIAPDPPDLPLLTVLGGM